MLEKIRRKIHQYFITDTEFLKLKDTMSEDQLRMFIAKTIDEACQKEEVTLTVEEKTSFLRELVHSVVSYGPIRSLIEDMMITEIMINGPKQIYIQKEGKIELTPYTFDNERDVLHMVQKMLSASGSGRRVDESSPYVDFSLSDGSRVNVILSPVSLSGPVVTIRKFSPEISKIENLIEKGTLNKEMATLLVAGIKAKLNMVFCGATGTGKTTTLNVLSRYAPQDERIITIEDTAELRLLQDHVVRLQAKSANIEGKGEITIRDLFVNSLRMRPDRIIIGEVRGSEALDMVQAITSGHSGSLAIVHADSPLDCFHRMVTMILMTGIQLSQDEIRRQVASAIDLIVHTELLMDGTRKITYITDVRHNKDTNGIIFDDIFHFNQEKVIEVEGEKKEVIGDWIFDNKLPSFYRKFQKRNIRLPEGYFEVPLT